MLYYIIMEQKAEIFDVHITHLTGGGMDCDAEGIFHKKILTSLSVVQPIHGSYSVKIGGSGPFVIEEGNVFVAPPNVTQEILHRNGAGQRMKAHWVFLDADIHGEYRFEDLFLVPPVLRADYNEEIYRLLTHIRFPKNYFEKISAGYRLLEILTADAQQQTNRSPIGSKLEKFVRQHYAEDIGAKDLADCLYCSVSQVFRYTRKYYNFSPANYINSIRLQQAEILLLNTEKTVSEIASAVGIADGAYFSKVFRKYYGVSPSNYRKNFLSDH